ncbi:hypothetical protein ACGF0D_09835 [Kitasatospora sp. NPDC048298]|uniref:hypothetical protein n=1 Tax=Kitasatospora sp. NPDC048298 TaxID=3364049 RepID=UPI003714A724
MTSAAMPVVRAIWLPVLARMPPPEDGWLGWPVGAGLLSPFGPVLAPGLCVGEPVGAGVEVWTVTVAVHSPTVAAGGQLPPGRSAVTVLRRVWSPAAGLWSVTL